MIHGTLAVSVPVVVDELHAADAPFDHASRQQAHSAKACRRFFLYAVKFLRRGSLSSDIHQLGSRGLHLERQLIVRDASFEPAVAGSSFRVTAIPVGQLIEHGPLLSRLQIGGLSKIFDRRAFRPNDGSLIQCGQVARLIHPVSAAKDAVAHRHVRGQVFTLAAQAVGHPRADARMPDQRRTGAKEIDRRAVNERVVMARLDDRQVISPLGKFREEAGDFQTRLTVIVKLERGTHQLAVGGAHELQLETVGAKAGRERLTIKALQLRLVIERIDLRWPAGHVEHDDALGLCREVGLACSK